MGIGLWDTIFLDAIASLELLNAILYIRLFVMGAFKKEFGGKLFCIMPAKIFYKLCTLLGCAYDFKSFLQWIKDTKTI